MVAPVHRCAPVSPLERVVVAGLVALFASSMIGWVAIDVLIIVCAVSGRCSAT